MQKAKSQKKTPASKTAEPPGIGSVLVLVLVCCTFSLRGQDLITDRPDFTESASAVPLGSWQFEFGYTFEGENSLKDHSIGELLVRFTPFQKNLEFRFGINSYRITKNGMGELKGFEDIQLGAKWAFVPDHAALLVSASVPTGAPGYRAARLEPGVTLALAQDINDTFSVGANLGWARLAGEDNRVDEYSASTAFGISLTPKLAMFLEYFGFYYEAAAGENIHFLDAGLTFLVQPAFQVDFRIGRILNKGRSAFFIGAGAVFRL